MPYCMATESASPFSRYPRPYKYKGREMEYRREWRDNNPELYAMVQRRSWLKTKYGITLEDEARLLREQGGGCAICGSTEPGRQARYFHVDHDHATGEVRGML